MANPEHLKILKQGVEVWNEWREENSDMWVDFSGINLSKINLSGALLYKVHFSYANLSEANLYGAVLSEASLYKVQLINADISKAKLLGAKIYGISAWDIKKDGLIQKDLVITLPREPEITVDDLEVAQFIYLMLNNEKIKHVIEEITSKAVLILGRFTPERKAVLDALKDELRRRNYLPIVFDFENAGGKSVDETVNLLARMSRFVVADITDAKSIPQELRGIVPDNPSVPIVPLIWAAQREYGMFDHFRNYPWVLPLHEYDSPEILLHNIIPAIITPAEQKVAELRGK